MIRPGSILGNRVLRSEDPGLLRGSRRYVADLDLPGKLYAAFARSPVAHGRLVEVHVAEARHMPGVVRSMHPLYSFAALGEGAERAMAAQSLAEPLGPLAHLAETQPAADVLLLGADHTANVAIHEAERRAGRKQFIRWALTTKGAVECAGCPGCPDGFNALIPHLRPISKVTQIGSARVERLPLGKLLQTVETLIRRDPAALLCSRPGCERCGAVRTMLTSFSSALAL